MFLCALVSRLVCARLTTCVRSSHDLCALVSRLVCARLTTCVRSSHDLCALGSRLVCARTPTQLRGNNDCCSLTNIDLIRFSEAKIRVSLGVISFKINMVGGIIIFILIPEDDSTCITSYVINIGVLSPRQKTPLHP